MEFGEPDVENVVMTEEGVQEVNNMNINAMGTVKPQQQQQQRTTYRNKPKNKSKLNNTRRLTQPRQVAQVNTPLFSPTQQYSNSPPYNPQLNHGQLVYGGGFSKSQKAQKTQKRRTYKKRRVYKQTRRHRRIIE